MSLNFEVISIKKGLEKEDFKPFIFQLSKNLIIEYQDPNDFNSSHTNIYNSFVNLKNKSIVIISEKFENTDKFKFSFSPTFQEAKDIIEIEEIERIID